MALFDINTLFDDSDGDKRKQANLKLNQSFSTMSSMIHLKNIIMVTFLEIPKDACKAFKQH
jgi:hypothetical protein